MSYMTKAATEKVLVLGVDGFEPRLAKYLWIREKPALKKFVKKVLLVKI